MSKITDYAALTSAATSDVLPIVDVSDTSMAASGTTKKITIANLAAAGSLKAFGIVCLKNEFGAVGDNSTDDTTAVQNFFTALATGGTYAGYRGFINAGTYKVTSAIVGGTHTVCGGAGKYAATIRQWTANQDVLQFSSGTMLGVELTDFSLTGPYHVDTGCTTTNTSTTVGDTHAVASDVGLSITGTGIPASTTISSVTPGVGYTISQAATATGTATLTIGGTSTGVGLNLNNWIDTCSAKRMIIQGNGSHGVLLQNSYVNSWEHVWFYNNGGDGLHAVTSINAVKFDNCEFFGNALNGASVDGAAGIQFSACDFETNGQHGLKFPHVYSGLVSACDFENNGTSSPGTTYAGIYVDATSGYAGVSVIGCNLTGTGATTANGVEVTANCTAFHIDDCSFNNFALNDILIDSGATGVVIGKNLVHQAGSGAFITDSGTSTTYLAAADTAALPSDINLKAWNFDPQTIPGTSAPVYSNYTAGVVFLARVAVRHPMLVSKIAVYWSAPSGGSPANAYFGLYSSAASNNRIDVTTELVGASTATGLRALALGASHNIAAGTYYVAFVIGTQGSTSGGPWYAANVPGPQFSVLAGAMGDLAVAAANYRWAKQLTGQTSLPSSLTLSSNSGGLGGAGNAQPFWCGLL